MNNEQEHPPLLVGVLTSDPLRLDGLDETLKASGLYRVVPLTEAERAEAEEFSVAIIDVTSVIHLEFLMREFRRRRPRVRVLVMGPEADLEKITSVIAAGAHGYVQYTANEAEWKEALEVVREGSIWAPGRVLGRLLEAKDGIAEAKARPTPREREVLRLLVQGQPNRQIAETLGVDETTVKSHLARLMRKLGARNRIALSMMALREHSLEDSDQ